MFPFILLIGLAVYASSRYAAAHAVADNNKMHVSGEAPYGTAPGPIVVLGELLRRGQYPSPQVIMCAIAEAESIGRVDVAITIVKTFIKPVVQQHQLAQARNANPMPEMMYAPPPPPPAYSQPPVYAATAMYGSPPMPSFTQAPPQNNRSGYDKFNSSTSRDMQNLWNEFKNAPRADEPMPVQVAAPAPAQAATTNANAAQRTPPMPHGMEHLQVAPNQPTDEELIAQVLAGHASAAAPEPGVAQANQAPPPSPASSPVSIAGEVSYETHRDRRPTMPPPHPEAPLAPSPLPEVDDAAWARFAASIEREAPTFTSKRAVGQYRQRRERLEELGINPDSIYGSPSKQRAAFDIDMADAFYHAREGGLLQNIRRMIKVPGSNEPCIVTLSGVLGVIQCAGLEGAESWFTNQADRKKYTYTTRMFLQQNGVF